MGASFTYCGVMRISLQTFTYRRCKPFLVIEIQHHPIRYGIAFDGFEAFDDRSEL